MPVYEVGKVYHPGKNRWQPGADFNYRSGMLELRLMFDKLTHSDIRAIRNGACTFALVVEGEIIFLLYEFGKACPWSDSPYTIHMVPENERTIPPELAPGEMALLTIILIGCEDGIIKAMRQISLGSYFSQKLYQAIQSQAQQPFNQAEYDSQLARTYRKYPTTQALLRQAQASCIVESKTESQN